MATTYYEPNFIIKTKVMTGISDEKIQAALLLALEETQERRIRTHDPSSDILEAKIVTYADGWTKTIPTWLKSYIAKIEQEADAEFREYTRLYEKFKGMQPRTPLQDFSQMPPRDE